jgi:pre-mRNA-splicing factor RBM22/SLT11
MCESFNLFISLFIILLENNIIDNKFLLIEKYTLNINIYIPRPFTLFKWRPGRGDAYKMTQICQTCSKVKNLCQTCILDLQYGLPSQLRDAVLSRADDETLAIPESEVNLEYQNQQQITALTNGLDPWASGETPNEKLLRLARNSTVHRDPSRIKLLPKPEFVETK